MAAYESLTEASMHRDVPWRAAAPQSDDPRSHSVRGGAIMYTEITHTELKSAEGDPYFKFPEWTPGSLRFKQHLDTGAHKPSGDSHMLTQFPSTVRQQLTNHRLPLLPVD